MYKCKYTSCRLNFNTYTSYFTIYRNGIVTYDLYKVYNAI